MLQSQVTPYLGMSMATTAQVGLIVISKRAITSGMSNYAFVAYSNALAAIILLPLALFVHRSPIRPPLTLSLLCGFFSLGILGCLAQLFGYTGISYTSASFASAMLNLIPGFTFVLAIIFRMEKLACRSPTFLAKSIGTAVSISGAFVVTLYRGPQFSFVQLSSNMLNQYTDISKLSWLLGGLFLTADCAVSSGFIIVQALILRNYPAELIIVFFYCLFAGILSASISLVVDQDPSAWALQPNIKLFAVLYSGIFGSAFQVGITSWCLHKRGPLFVAMFHPLGIVIAAALDIILFGEVLYIGSLVGSIIIVIGFYSVMWGKAKEVNSTTDTETRAYDSTNVRAPLLPTKDESSNTYRP